ncbi:C39 family peptidase [Campylobacter avium]|uniref:C39 family peptidase n=1 Tax=Campylobacter avium TaxID=522485 RepID=UPI00235524FD|nr:cysteine peptidase family C39 domain-containing protein [Campylobacter avium]
MPKYIALLIFSILFARAEFAVKSINELRNENFVRQGYEESCGAASIANLVNFFSLRQIKEEDVLGFLNQKTDMLSFLELKNAAQKMGYESEGYILSRQEFENLSLPVLVKVENDPRFPHFVVVINQKGDFVRILDPNFGSYIASRKEFFSIWDKDDKGGYTLIILPKDISNFNPNLDKELFSNFYLDRFKF